MKSQKKETGKKGEELAVAYLLKKGFEILCRNYRFKRAEIDLICKKDQLLVFVEVKFRSNVAYGLPEDAVSNNQQEKIIEAAENYLFENQWESNIRFDILSVLYLNGKLEISHFEDAFY